MQSKKGLVLALVALVAVVGIAGGAYALLGKSETANTPLLATNTAASADAEATSAATTSAATTSAASTEVAAGESAQEVSEAEKDATLPGDPAEAASSDAASAGPIKLPDFTVVDLDGKEAALSNVYGKPALVGFWATWCPPCNAEAPELQKLYETYGDRINFMMIDAASDGRDNMQKVIEWMDKGGYTYPVFVDETGDASDAAQIYYLPTMFVLDAEGNVLTAFSGALDEQSGSQLCEQLLAL